MTGSVRILRQAHKRLPKDYDEYDSLSGKRELLGDAFSSFVTSEDEEEYTLRGDEETRSKSDRTRLEGTEFGDVTKTEQNTESGTESRVMNPEQVEENLQQLRTMQSEEWVDLGQDQREEYIKTLQKVGLMSRVLVGTMASVDPEQIDRPGPVEYAKDGATSAGVSGTATTARNAGKNAVTADEFGLADSVATGATKGGLKGIATVLTAIAADRLGTKEKITELGDRLETDLLKTVKGIHSQSEQTQDSSDSFDEIVVELVRILEEEELFDEHYD